MRGFVGILCLTTAGFAMADSWPSFDDWWDYDDPVATEARFRELLVREPPDLDYRIQLTTQLARTLGLQGNFDDASLHSAGGARARATRKAIAIRRENLRHLEHEHEVQDIDGGCGWRSHVMMIFD